MKRSSSSTQWRANYYFTTYTSLHSSSVHPIRAVQRRFKFAIRPICESFVDTIIYKACSTRYSSYWTKVHLKSTDRSGGSCSLAIAIPVQRHVGHITWIVHKWFMCNQNLYWGGSVTRDYSACKKIRLLPFPSLSNSGISLSLVRIKADCRHWMLKQALWAQERPCLNSGHMPGILQDMNIELSLSEQTVNSAYTHHIAKENKSSMQKYILVVIQNA